MPANSADLPLPVALLKVAEIGFELRWDDETDSASGCDFEVYEEFEAPDETAEWFRGWTGNSNVDGSQFRFFGSTGGGDYAGFWLVRPDAGIVKQPVVYIGSEGDVGVIARDLGDLLWLFANGSAPAEAFDDPGRRTQPSEALRAIAEQYAPGKSRPTMEIVAAAREEFPNFSEVVDAMCQ
ncbi:uncharacterized protein BJX67DRAFT_228628 [Aspergillus lucknowensis]|uniref:SMI1/KNR4 family protein n=1 Tax=Aspergillus lucknowensis TaxID=176173 RepID=A0ABR4LI87_9EURO